MKKRYIIGIGHPLVDNNKGFYTDKPLFLLRGEDVESQSLRWKVSKKMEKEFTKKKFKVILEEV